MGEVKIWESEVIEGRVYQGSSGKVYPYPTIETISDVKTDKTYRAVWLENEYLRVMILPQLGGPWISGGIEFNWPQHHRPTTFSPVDYMLTENPDSSKTCRVSDVDQMYGTKGEACFTLYPGKAYIEIRGQLYNRTAQPQTFLWWANPAVPVNENTQSIFPPDVHAVMDHGKRDVSRFPIAAGEYYKHDYSAGVDISRYKNIPVPTSYMAEKSAFDFVGGYDYGRQAGILHAADHHIAPGKKQWTWGCGDFGKAWDRNLTDEDGPYDEGAALSPVRTYQKTVEFTPEDETMLTVRVLDGNRGLKAYLLRKLGRGEQTGLWIAESLGIDPFDYVSRLERARLGGAFREAMDQAERCPQDYCFPNKLEDLVVLEWAKASNPKPANACYYLGCLYYDKLQYEAAMENWERSARLAPRFPTVWRNLALVYYNKRHNSAASRKAMERACALAPQNARLFLELDQLYKKLEVPAAERLARYKENWAVFLRRDDLKLEYATLLNLLGRYQEAYNFIMSCRFHPWEGGEGKLEGTKDNHINYYLGLVNEQLGDAAEARACFERAAEAFERAIREEPFHQNAVRYWESCQ